MLALVGACGGSSPSAQGSGGTHAGGGGGAGTRGLGGAGAGPTGAGGGAAGGASAGAGGAAGLGVAGGSGSGGSGMRAVLTISDGPTYDFGTWATGAKATHVFVLANSGTGVATGIAMSGAIGTSYSYAGGTFPGLGGTCTTTLSAGSGCALVVTFSPAAAATFTGSVAVAYNDGAAAQTAARAVTGVGTALAALAITDWPAAYYASYGLTSDAAVFDFGQVGIGSSIDHTFIVTNNGAAAATITAGSALAAPYSYAGGAFPGSGGKCAGTLAPGASCSVVVSYTGTAGTSPSSFTVTYTGGATASVTRNLTGTGTSSAVLQIHDFASGQSGIDLGATWDFGTVGLGGKSEHTFIVINSGGASATNLGAGAASAPFAYPGGFPGGPAGAPAPNSGDTTLPYCGTTLPAGAACAVLARFTPTVAGAVSAALAISYDTTSSATRSVKGVGTALAFLTIAEEDQQGLLFDFGTRALSSTTSQIFFVTNGGGQAATNLTPATLPSGFSFSGAGFLGGTATYTDRNGTQHPYCTTGSLSPGATCAFSVDFKPTASTACAGTIGVSYGDGSGTTASATRAIQGSGTAQAIVSISNCRNCGGGGGDKGNTADVGTVPVNATRTVFAFVTNSGSTAAMLGDGGLTGGSFTYAGGAYPGGSGTTSANGTSYPFCGPAPYSLAGGATCVVQIVYTAPATSGTQSGNLTVTTGAATTASVSMALTAASTSLAVVSMTNCLDCGGGGRGGTPTQDFGLVRAGGTSSVYFLVSNSGAAAATLTPGTLTGGPAFDYTGGSYPGATAGSAVQLNGKSFNFCPAAGGSLAAGGRCVIGVTYAASGTVTQTGSISLAVGNATTSTVSYNLTGTPTTLAIVSINDNDCDQCGGGGPGPRTHDFGQVASGTVTATYFFVTNTGAGAATLTDGGITGAAFSYTGGSYPGGTAGSQVMINGNPWNFCPASGGSLPGGSRCVLSVSYTASGAAQQSGNLSLGLGNATSSSLAYDFVASPTDKAIVSMSDCANCGGPSGPAAGNPTHDFGLVATSGTRTAYFFVSNTGAGAATLTSGSLTGAAYAYAGSGYPGGAPASTVNVDGGSYAFCPASGGTLAGGDRCLVAIVYSASGSAAQTGVLSIALGGATTSAVGYNLTGTPTALAIVSVSNGPNGGGCCGNPPTQDFGTVATGTVNTAFFFVQNSGAASATVTDAAITGAAFGFSGGSYPGGTAGATVDVWGNTYKYCPAAGGALVPGTSCVIGVTYTASGTATQSGSMSLTLTGATTPTITYGLAGHPTTSAIVSLGPCLGCGNGGNFDFGTAGTNLDAIVVVQNGGMASAGLTDGSTLTASFTYSSGTFPGGMGTAMVFGQSVAFCSATLAAGAACAVSIRYSGAVTGQSVLTLNLTGASSPTAAMTVSGTRTKRALITVYENDGFFGCTSCGPFDFGTVTSPNYASRDFFVTNRGALATTALDAGTALPSPFSFGPMGSGAYPGGTGVKIIDGVSYDYCGAVLSPGAQCVVTVNLAPAPGAGVYASAIDLAYSDSVGPSAQDAIRNISGASN